MVLGPSLALAGAVLPSATLPRLHQLSLGEQTALRRLPGPDRFAQGEGTLFLSDTERQTIHTNEHVLCAVLGADGSPPDMGGPGSPPDMGVELLPRPSHPLPSFSLCPRHTEQVWLHEF